MFFLPVGSRQTLSDGQKVLNTQFSQRLNANVAIATTTTAYKIAMYVFAYVSELQHMWKCRLIVVRC